MWNKDREYLYSRKSLFEKPIYDEALPSFIVNFSKTYLWNKKELEKIFKNDKGIWIIKDNKEAIKRGEVIQVYDVAETSYIKDECIKCLQYLFLGKRDYRKNLYNQKYIKRQYTRYKYQQIYLSANRKSKRNRKDILEIKQVYLNNDRNNRLKQEINIAVDLEARYWSPNPQQHKNIEKILKK